MDQHLMIESDDAVRLAAELSALTGESIEVAVTAALRQRLETERTRKEKVRKILALAAEIRAHMTHPLPSSDHKWLYDEQGFPL